MIKLLCIANPQAYQHTVTDIPLSYARLAVHPDVKLYHTDTMAMMQPGPWLDVVPVQPGFLPEEFEQLPTRAHYRVKAEDFDLAFCRTLKPFPTGYLDQLKQWTQFFPFVNNPSGIARQLNVDFLLKAAGQFTPPALVTNEQDIAQQFLNKHRTIVVKRSNSCGGRGVYKVSVGAQAAFIIDNVTEGPQTFFSFAETFRYVTKNPQEKVLLMSYLPRVTEGDRRIVVMDGKILGTYIRRSKSGHWVQNLSLGSTCELMAATNEDHHLVSATAPYYQQEGIRLLGYDLLLDNSGTWKISEINAGNIGGLFRLESLGIGEAPNQFVNQLCAGMNTAK